MREPPPDSAAARDSEISRTPSPIGVRLCGAVPLAQCAAAGARRHLAARPGPLTAALRPCRGPGRGGPPALSLSGGRILAWARVPPAPARGSDRVSVSDAHERTTRTAVARSLREPIRPLGDLRPRPPSALSRHGVPTGHPSPARPPTPDVNVDQHRSPHGMHEAPTRTRCP